MIQRTEQEIRWFLQSLWPAESDQKVEIEIKPEYTEFTITQMYDPPGLGFSHLKQISEFFGTDNVDDPNRISQPGCESCDYGSCYGFTIRVW